MRCLFKIRDMDQAAALVNDPDAARVGDRAGVLDGDVKHVEAVAP